MTEGRCLKQLGVRGAVSTPADQGSGLVGVQGVKPPEAREILFFWRPQNGLKFFSFLFCILSGKTTINIIIAPRYSII